MAVGIVYGSRRPSQLLQGRLTQLDYSRGLPVFLKSRNVVNGVVHPTRPRGCLAGPRSCDAHGLFEARLAAATIEPQR